MTIIHYGKSVKTDVSGQKPTGLGINLTRLAPKNDTSLLDLAYTILKRRSPTTLTGNEVWNQSVVPGGFEPPLTEPKTVVLPLHHRTIWVQR